MENVTGADLRSFFIVIAALVVFMNAILGLIKNIKEARKPATDLDEWRRNTEQKLNNDNKRLANLEEGHAALCTGMYALLKHETTGDNVKELETAQKDLMDYLIKARSKAVV